jgi:glycosyltransferase involved in cell wall biosynthesis
MDTSALQHIVVANYPAAHRSMRISVVTETYPPEVNGVAMTLAQLVDGMHRRNHDVQLIRPKQDVGDAAGQGARFSEVLMRGMPVPYYPSLRMGVPSKRVLVKLWSTHRPDVVHIATEGPLGWSALQAARHLKLPVTSDFRTNFHAYSRYYGMGWLNKPIMAYLRKFHNQARCTMVPTEALRRELEGKGFRHLSVVTRGVDSQRFAPTHRSAALRASWGAGPDDLVVLLATFEAVRSAVPGARLVLVGDGPLRAELQSQCPSATFAGHQSGRALAEHYASFDLFLFPSLTETFGNVTTEAMASGLPVVAFDHAAAAQLIRSGDNGLLAPCADAPAFMRGALALAGDTERRRAMGVQARQSACALDWDQIVARFEGVLSSVIYQSQQGLRHAALPLRQPAA